MYPLHPEGILGANLLSLGGGVDTLIPNGGMMLPPDMSVALGGNMVIPPLDPSALAHPHGMPPMGDMPAITSAGLQAQTIAAAATQAPRMPIAAAVTAPLAPPPTTQPEQQASASASASAQSSIPTEAPIQDAPPS